MTLLATRYLLYTGKYFIIFLKYVLINRIPGGRSADRYLTLWSSLRTIRMRVMSVMNHVKRALCRTAIFSVESLQVSWDASQVISIVQKIGGDDKSFWLITYCIVILWFLHFVWHLQMLSEKKDILFKPDRLRTWRILVDGFSGQKWGIKKTFLFNICTTPKPTAPPLNHQHHLFNICTTAKPSAPPLWHLHHP